MSKMDQPRFCRAILFLGVLLVTAGTLAQEGSTLEGTIYDSEGNPVPECRVVARVADGTRVYISPPSDGEGRYAVTVPRGGRYVIVALVSPTGGRVSMPDPSPLTASSGSVVRDLNIPGPVPPRPREGVKGSTAVDRFFLNFVEDTAMTGRQYWELQADRRSDTVAPDVEDLRLIGAFRVSRRVELGFRGAYRNLDVGGAGESGMTDAELWGKFLLKRSSNMRWDLVLGGLVTIPAGDEAKGLGRDALQSKLFLAASYQLPSVALIVNAGVRTTEDGMLAGLPLDGRISGTAGLGVFFPVTRRVSAVIEAAYEDDRFEESGSDSRVLAGLNIRAGRHGLLRLALGSGLEDTSPDSELLLGYAVRF